MAHVKSVPKNITSPLISPVFHAQQLNQTVSLVQWVHLKIVPNVLPIITSPKRLSVLNVLITVSPVDLNNIVTSATLDIIWSKMTNNMLATVPNVMIIVSLVSINPKIVSHAKKDFHSVLLISASTKISSSSSFDSICLSVFSAKNSDPFVKISI